VQGLKALVQPAQLVDQLLEVIGVAGGLLAGHGVFHLALAVEHRSGFSEGLEQLLAHAAGQINIKFLLEVNDAGIPLLHHLAAAGLLHPGDDPHLGGFTGAVHAHQADAIPRLHLPGDIPQHLTGGIDLRDAFETKQGDADGGTNGPL